MQEFLNQLERWQSLVEESQEDFSEMQEKLKDSETVIHQMLLHVDSQSNLGPIMYPKLQSILDKYKNVPQPKIKRSQNTIVQRQRAGTVANKNSQ